MPMRSPPARPGAQQTGAIAGAGFRSERNHHGTGNARPRTRRSGAGYRYAAGVGGRRRSGRRGSPPGTLAVSRSIGVEPLASPTPDQGTGGRPSGRCRRPAGWQRIAGAAARRRTGLSDRCRNTRSEPCWCLTSAIASAQATLWRALRIVAEPVARPHSQRSCRAPTGPARGERIAVIVSAVATTARR